MDITELRTETAEWDAFVRASGEGSPFQLVAWKRAVERTFGLRAHYLMARENGRLAGVLPLFEARELFGRRALISVPYAVYGGICATSDAARRALVDAATVLGQSSWLESKVSEGGTALARVREQLAAARDALR